MMNTIIPRINNQKKKVLLVITKSNYGGAQKYVHELAQNLKQNGLEVVIAMGGDGILFTKLQTAGIRTITIPHLGRDVSLLKDIASSVFLLTTIRKERPDVVHLNSSKIGAIGALVSRLVGVPTTVFTIHGWAFNESRSVVSRLAIGLTYLFTLLLVNKAIAVSDETRRQARFIPFSSLVLKKIEVVHNGISIPEFMSRDVARSAISKIIGTDISNKKIVGQIAELHPIKSISTTILAASDIMLSDSDIVFIIIGEGEQRKHLEAMSARLGVNDRVYFLGFLDGAAEYLKAFDLFCLTSKSEALALVLLEAGLAKVPIIASRVGGIPEVVEHEETGLLFEFDNHAQLASMITRVLSMPEQEKAEYTSKMSSKVHSKFMIENMTKRTIEIYSA